MLKQEDFTREFSINSKTDRDAEVPLLLEYIEKRGKVPSLLDVGAHYSGHYYAQELRKKVRLYDGIDILPLDDETKDIHNNYYIGNANDLDWNKKYDTVICVSTIEHAGVSTYKTDDIKKEQNRLFLRCLDLAMKHVWFSFPTGLPYSYPNELSVITEEQLSSWEKLVIDSGYSLKERFIHNQAGPPFNTPWREHEKREAACKQQYWDYCGTQSITVLEIEK